MNRIAIALAFACAAASLAAAPANRPASEERLSFQSFAPWSPRVNLNADVAMVYGVDPSLSRRIATWRDRGYIIHVMTGVSWGQYQDYLYGRFDGKNHEDEAQTDARGNRISHGGDVYYMSPGENYGKFLCVGVKRAIDAGAAAIHLEEPEFWVRGGYEENFKRQWKASYGDEWQPPDSSADAQYRASKLKYHLYRRALSQVFSFVREYSGGKVRCYVPTHSLLNYAHWRIVSPESSLIDVGCDGYIAQVWTGTARTPNVYEGRLHERTFETAFLEYGAMQNLVRASGRRVWYLNDPVEDNPNHTWEDYRYNWESTLVASLLQSEVHHYEIMPWPDRVFRGRYPTTRPGVKVGISHEYETELQAVITALGDMKQAEVKWDICGTQGIGVLVSDTMMFQRGGPSPSDAHLGSFYGLALPLLKHGIPVEPVQMENAASKGFLDGFKVLLLTYEGQKPPSAACHEALAAWVRHGGALLIFDDDKDPFNGVKEWWNSGENHFATPRQHLCRLLGIKTDGSGPFAVGDGIVRWQSVSPAALCYRKEGAELVRASAFRAATALNVKCRESNALVLRRGPYVIAAGLDESLANTAAPKLRGRFINLMDAELPLLSEVEVSAGKRLLLVDVDVAATHEGVIAAACRVREQQVTPEAIRFRADGIEQTQAVVCVAMKSAPRQVMVAEKAIQWVFNDGVMWLKFEDSIDGKTVEILR